MLFSKRKGKLHMQRMQTLAESNVYVLLKRNARMLCAKKRAATMHFSLRMRHGLGPGQVRSTILRQFFFSISPFGQCAPPNLPKLPFQIRFFLKSRLPRVYGLMGILLRSFEFCWQRYAVLFFSQYNAHSPSKPPVRRVQTPTFKHQRHPRLQSQKQDFRPLGLHSNARWLFDGDNFTQQAFVN